MRDVLLILFGWLVGLLSGPIGDAIRRQYEKRELASAIRAELLDVLDRAVVSAYHIRKKHGTFGRPQMQWTAEMLELSTNEDSQTIAKGLREQLELTDAQLQVLGYTFQAKTVGEAAKTIGSSVRSLETPFLDAQIHRIGIFKPLTQQRLFHARSQARMFNELADEARRFHGLTFQTLTTESYAVVVGNARSTEERIALRAQEIVRAINQLKEIR